MGKWDYLVLVEKRNDVFLTIEDYEVVETPTMDLSGKEMIMLDIQGKPMSRVLKLLGDSGWELFFISVSPHNEHRQFFFKKKK
jgi:hypothetical protein